jgi:AAA domain-containing protein
VKAPARAVVGQLVWSTDGGVWAVWRVHPYPHAHTAPADKLGVHAHIRGLLISLPSDSALLSVCEPIDPWDVAHGMATGVDLVRQPAWQEVCEATASWLDDVPMYRRRYYVAALLPGSTTGWRDSLREGVGGLTSLLGLTPAGMSEREVALRRRQAAELAARLAPHVRLEPATTGEICWLYARALQRHIAEPSFDESWEPPPPRDDAPGRRVRGVLAHLTDVVVKEGGYADDVDRPRHRRYVRIDAPHGTAYQTVLAMADMPHHFVFPGGGGEWLYHADDVDFPIDWCVRIRSVENLDAQAKVRRKQRDLVGQFDEYDGEVTGTPPQLMHAVDAIEQERAELAANPAEPELQATILLSVAAPTLAELEHQAAALTAMFRPMEYGLARPTGGQLGLLRSMLPGTAAAAVCRDYTQFLLPRDLAAGGPFCGPEVGDPAGLLLGLTLDGGTAAPVLFDPAYGPRVNTSPSLAAVGRLGSGKSYFLKRLCWDTVARGGQVVTIDRTSRGEYVTFAEAMSGRVQVVRLEAGADVCLDPLRSFGEDERAAITLGFLSLLAGSATQSDEGAALAEAVDTVAERPDARLADVVDELVRLGEHAARPDPVARSLARRLGHYRRSPTGQLAFGDGLPLALDADFIVFWAPGLALPDRETLESEHRARMMLPEQVLGQALLYLVAAVGRRVVFSDPSRFAAALYDEAWALLASPHGQKLLIEGVRDGRKHNGAIWLASQHPDDLAIGELTDLLGPRFVFSQARGAIPSALRFLGVAESVDAAATLEMGLGNGQALCRDVRDRVGLMQVLPPTLPAIRDAFETTPTEHVTVELVDTPMGALDDPQPTPARSSPVDDSQAIPALPPLPPGPPDLDAARRRARRRRRSPIAEVLDGQGPR